MNTVEFASWLTALRHSIAMLVLCVSPLFAQDGTPASPPPPDRADSTGTGWTFEWAEHPSLHLGDDITIDFRARLQGEVTDVGSAATEVDRSGFDVARRRVGVAGSIGRRIEFQVEHEIGATDPWRDVYVDYRQSGRLRFQAGHFKLPFGLDENTSDSQQDFVYRSRAATELAPGRDRGVMAYGRVRKVLRYEAGVFAHDGDNARGHNPTRVFGDVTSAGRITWQPLRSSKSRFEDAQVGVALTTSSVPEGVSDLPGHTAIGQTFVPKQFFVNGRRLRVGLEARWRPGPFSIQSEYSRLSTERRGQSVFDTDLPPLIGTAWYVSGAWIVTGERKTRGASEPARPLFHRGLGSLELAARVERFAYESHGGDEASTGPRAETIAPYVDRAMTLGFNWWPTRWTRLQVNFIRDAVRVPTDVLSTPTTSWGRVVRFQIAL